jgi:2-hydroxychromene-2-carboxylate isomerase
MARTQGRRRGSAMPNPEDAARRCSIAGLNERFVISGPVKCPEMKVDARAPIFYYDLGSPECYLAAERISAVLPVAPRWEPVLGRWENGVRGDESSSALPGLGPEPERPEIERVARERGLQGIRWPVSWPPDSLLAMRAASYAKSIGRVTAFSLAAFRQAFAGGRDLADPDTVVIAAAACEMHPAAVLKAVDRFAVQSALAQATERAVQAGVRHLPAVVIGEGTFEGDRGLEEAAAVLPAMA